MDSFSHGFMQTLEIFDSPFWEARFTFIFILIFICPCASIFSCWRARGKKKGPWITNLKSGSSGPERRPFVSTRPLKRALPLWLLLHT